MTYGTVGDRSSKTVCASFRSRRSRALAIEIESESESESVAGRSGPVSQSQRRGQVLTLFKGIPDIS